MDLNMKVLVVDDFKTMRKVLINILHNLGFENISEAENGKEGFRMAQTGDFNLIVSDWNMPEWSGLEFLKAVRGDEKTEMIPFLMVTAEALKENIIQAINAGANNYIVKPFTANTIKDKLQTMFE